MPKEVQREEVCRLLTDGAQVVDVLHEEEYRLSHLPGALNISLRHLNPARVTRLRRDRPVVVYCFDSQ